MNKPYIYHICTEDAWNAQSNSDAYIHPSIREEGFIHCSEKQQIEGVLERYFTDQRNLIVLTIDTSKVDVRIQYDKAPNGEDFPHIYGQLNKDAIIEIRKIKD